MSLRRQAQVEGGRDDSWDARLRAVEGDVREIKTRIEESATKTDIAYVKTHDLKTDIAHLKIWVLGGVITTLGGIVTAFLWLIQPILQDLVQALIQIGPPA